MENKDLHMFEYRGIKLVYDVHSGSLHRVDELGWQIVQLLLDGKSNEEIPFYLAPQFPPAEVEEALGQVKDLVEKRLLFAPSPAVRPAKDREVRALCLFVSHGCNLRCKYCFTQQQQGSRMTERETMKKEVGKKAVDFLLGSGEGPFREIDFFGGEPLLNYSLVKEVVSYARENESLWGKKFNFTLTTNALLLNKQVADHISSENISVILSLDGRPEVNDALRTTADGSGSYKTVVKNIHILLDRREPPHHYIRGTITRNNLDFCNDIEHLLEQGFYNLSLEPAVLDRDSALSLREKDLPRLEEQYDLLVELYLQRHKEGQPFSFYHFELDLEKGPCIYKRLSGCGAGIDYMAVAADGSLYPCHQFIGEHSFYMGNVLSGQPLQSSGLRNKLAIAAEDRDDCYFCWARYLCGRGCAAASYYLGGALEETYDLGCALQKIRLERALYLQAV